MLTTGKIKKQEEYWLKQFPGKPPVLDLSPDFPRPLIQSFEGEVIDFQLEKEHTRDLKALVKETGTTLYMMLLALYSILLSKLTRQKDIIIGSPIVGRGHPDLENIIGMLTETIVIRSYPEDNKPFVQFLSEVKATTLGAYENQQYPFGELLKKVDFQVIEVGLGGRLDATNVVQPEVSVITTIGFDHTEVLGNTITEIATEKAGIIRRGGLVVSSPQVDEADKVIEKTC